MWDIREIKKVGKQKFYRNFWKAITVCFIAIILTGGVTVQFVKPRKIKDAFNIEATINNFTSKSNATILYEFLESSYQNEISVPMPKASAGVLANIANHISKSESFLFGLLNALNQMIFNNKIVEGVIIIVGAVLGFLYSIFIASSLKVGKSRFFLENRNYRKTKVNRIYFPYKVKKMGNVGKGILLKNIYLFLWSLTVVGGPIKYYSYRMVTYLLAENPTLKPKEAILLSRKMTDGYKWKLFLLDVSYIGYYIIGFLTFNIFNLLYTNPYKESVYAEVYMLLRKRILKRDTEDTHYFRDKKLEEKNTKLYYPSEEYFITETRRKWNISPDQNYSIPNLILLFFSACLIGWIWEVILNLFQNGTFANKGTLNGPWLPIYGSGAVLVLILLKKVRKRPVLTFFLTFLICGIVEYGTGCYLEFVHHMKWWDYNGYLMNIGGKVCLEGLLVFGTAGCAFIYIVAPYLNKYIEKIPVYLKNIICLLLSLLLMFDFYYSGKHPNTGKGISSKLKEEISLERREKLK